MIGLCGSLGLATTAEGVETNEQLEILRAEQCNEVQGHLFSAPRSPGEIPILLKSFANIRSAAAKRNSRL